MNWPQPRHADTTVSRSRRYVYLCPMQGRTLLNICLLGCFALFWTQARGQRLEIRAEGSGELLEGVVVTALPSGLASVTDKQGVVELSAFPSWDSLFVSALGYVSRIVQPEQVRTNRYRVLLQADPIALQTVVVGASRWAQSRREVPQRLAVVRPAEVRLQQPQTAADLLALSGEVFIQKSQQGGGSPMIRGFAANRLLIAVDGVRLNTAIFRSGNLQNVIVLDPFLTSQTEVLFGPGSLSYGSDAIGGVMHFVSRTPALVAPEEPFLRGAATLRYASANQEKTGHLHLEYGRGKWAFLTGFSHNTYEDLRMGRYGPDEYLRPTYALRVNNRDTVVDNPDPLIQVGSGYRQRNITQKIRYQPNARTDIRYALHHSESSDIPRYDRLIRPRGNTLRSAEWTYGPQVWVMNHLQLDHRLDHSWADLLSFRLAHQYHQESRRERNLNSPLRIENAEEVQAWSLNLDLTRGFGAENRLLYGMEGVVNTVGSRGSTENILDGSLAAAPSRYPDGALWQSWGLYGLYQHHIDERWHLQGGLRYNLVGVDARFDTSFFAFPFREARQLQGALTGSAGVVWHPTEAWQWSLQFASAFRAPNVDDLGKVFDSAPGIVIIPNPGLRPEYARSLDVGVMRTLFDRIRLDVGAYGMLLDRAMVRRDFTLNGQDSIIYGGELSRVQALQNAAQARVWGVQAGLEWRLPLGFTLRARVNVQEGREELEDGSTARLRHAAPFFGMAGLRWSRGNWEADLHTLFNGQVPGGDLPPEELGKEYLYARDAEGRLYTPAWAVWHFKASWQVLDNMRLQAGVENITDRRYRPYSSGITAPGRNIQGALMITF